MCVIVPAQINKSACLGEPLKTSEPNLAISLSDDEKDEISKRIYEIANDVLKGEQWLCNGF